MSELREELRTAINRSCAENGSNTPDFILAKFLEGCLTSFDAAVIRRADWYGHELESIKMPELPPEDTGRGVES